MPRDTGATAVRTKRQLIDLVRAHAATLKALGVARLGLFGSFVRQEQNPDSDVDMLVEFAPGQKPFDNFMQLSFLLEDLLGRRGELVTTESLSPYIGPHLLREGEYISVVGHACVGPCSSGAA